jgi:hypothetical protein
MTEPFVMLPRSVLRSRLSSNAKLLLALLADYQNRQTRQCNPGISKLADELHVSARTIDRTLAELSRFGLVRIIWRQRTSHYEVAPRSQWNRILLRQIGVSENPVTPKWRNALRQIGVSDAPVSLLTYPEPKNQKKSVVVAVVSQSRKAPPRPATPPPTTATVKNLSKNGTPPDGIRTIAATLVAELMATHPKAGEPKRAIAAAESVLRASADVNADVAAMRRNHAAWCDLWNAQPAGTFIPFLDLWFSRGYYDAPPSAAATDAAKKPPASQRRKSQMEQMFDAIREKRK